MPPARVFRVIFETPEGRRAIDCAEDEFIWNAAERAGLRLPALCHQGWCLTCAARVLAGEVDQSAAFSYFDVDREARFGLLCTAKPRSNLVLETNEQAAMRKHRASHGLPAPYV